MLSAIDKFFRAFQKVLLALISAALLIMMAVIFVQVFTRYVIFYSLPWSEELSRYLFVFIVIVGINIAVTQDKLIKIDAIQNLIKTVKGRAGISLMHAVVGAIACILIASYAVDLFPVGRVQKSPAMRIPMIIMYSVVFGGYVLSTIALILKAIEHIKVIMDPANTGVLISKEQDIQEAAHKE